MEYIHTFDNRPTWIGWFYEIKLDEFGEKMLELIACISRKPDSRKHYLPWVIRDFTEINFCEPLEDLLKFNIMYQIDKRINLDSIPWYEFETPEDSLEQANWYAEFYGGEKGLGKLNLLYVTMETPCGAYWG